MATTPTGYPYPVGTDRVMDGDDAIKALAEHIPQIQGGKVDVTLAADTQSTTTVTFPKAFPGVPFVVVGVGTPGGPSYNLAVWAGTTTATNFVLAAKRGAAGTVTFYWIAYYPPVTP